MASDESISLEEYAQMGLAEDDVLSLLGESIQDIGQLAETKASYTPFSYATIESGKSLEIGEITLSAGQQCLVKITYSQTGNYDVIVTLDGSRTYSNNEAVSYSSTYGCYCDIVTVSKAGTYTILLYNDSNSTVVVSGNYRAL